MAIRTDLMEAIMEFRYRDEGWSERLWLVANTYTAALAALGQITAQRLAILPDTAQLVYARTSFVGSPRERKVMVADFPLPGTAHTAHAGPPAYVPVLGTTNNVETAIHVQLDTAAGLWANYYLRCLPDDVVVDQALVSPVAIPGANASPNEASWYERVGNYVQLMLTLAVYASFRASAVPPAGPSYEAQAWTGAILRGLSNRKTGRPFGVPRGRRLTA